MARKRTMDVETAAKRRRLATSDGMSGGSAGMVKWLGFEELKAVKEKAVRVSLQNAKQLLQTSKLATVYKTFLRPRNSTKLYCFIPSDAPCMRILPQKTPGTHARGFQR
jgi:hypothetical protein